MSALAVLAFLIVNLSVPVFQPDIFGSKSNYAGASQLARPGVDVKNCLEELWKRSGDELVPAVRSAAQMHQEDHILATFK